MIVVTWNVRDLLVGCIEALLTPQVRGSLDVEIIVVDNASNDGTSHALERFPQVRVLTPGRNLGYARGNNLGLREARGRHYLVLNPDTVPQMGSMETLLCFLEAHPKVGIVSPRLLNPDGSMQEAAFRFPTLAMAALDLFPLPKLIPGRLRRRLLRSRINGRYPHEERASRPFRIDHPLGACMLVRSEAYRHTGGFDPNLRMYSEEVDLALRMGDAGWECWQVPQARVVHFGGQSTRQLPDRMFVELWRSRLYVYRKHYTPLAQFGLRAMLALALAWDAAHTFRLYRRREMAREEARRRWRKAGAVLRMALHPVLKTEQL